MAGLGRGAVPRDSGVTPGERETSVGRCQVAFVRGALRGAWLRCRGRRSTVSRLTILGLNFAAPTGDSVGVTKFTS